MAEKSLEEFFRKITARKGYPSFWIINTLGWVFFIASDTFIVSPDDVLKSWHTLLDNTLQWSTAYLATIGLRYFYMRFRYREKSIILVLVVTLFSSLVASIIIFYAAQFIFIFMNPVEYKKYADIIFTYRYLALRLTQILPLITSWSLMYFGIKFWLDWSKERDRAEKLNLLAQSAQLQMLRYQVNPHFLFNSFSSLRALIRSNQKKAEEMVSKLSDFYRYSLTIKNSSEVPLIDEVEAVERFFEIEKIRFGDKLEYNITIDPLAEEYPVPCFTIHPLVENAIKYGMQTSRLPLLIKINASVVNNNLKICVANSGKWLRNKGDDGVYGTNTGLDNLRSRLAYSFPNNHKVDIKEENGFVKVIIGIYKEMQ